jgi:hypothetical protein
VNRFIKNHRTLEKWFWSREIADGYLEKNDHWYSYVNVWTFFKASLSILFGLFLASTVSALYIKITIICSPVFIL